MALPEIDMNDDLEADDSLDEGTDDQKAQDDGADDVDPMFAADIDATGLDLDDSQVAALQRAILGLMSNMGGGGAPGGGAPAAPF